MKYSNKTHKIRKLWDKKESLANEIDKLEKLTNEEISLSQNKKIYKIPIIENEELLPTARIFEYELEGFPERIIPYLRIVPILSTEDGQLKDYLDDNYILTITEFRYLFEEISEDHYKLVGRIHASLKDGAIVLPLYLDLSIYILNEEIFHEIQTKSE